jgi:Domain of unknown function (DUF5034)
MILKKAGIVLLVAFTARMVIACCQCSNGTAILRYSYQSLKVTSFDNSGEQLIPAQSGPVAKEAYGITLDLNFIQIASERGSLFPSAYAFKCSCEPSFRLVPKDSIIAIAITSLHDFDDTHPSGSVVTGYFRALAAGSYITVGNYLAHVGKVNYPIGEFNLYLLTPPQVTGDYAFKVDVTLSDNRVMSDTTSLVNLQ